MKHSLQYYLPICALAVMLTAIPEQYMPRVDAFLYTLTHSDLHSDNTQSNTAVTAQVPTNDTESTSETETRLSESDYTNFAIAQVDNYVNVRSIPSTEGDIVGKLPGGSVAEIQATAGEANDWFQIISGNVNGYIKAEYFLSGEEAAAVMDDYVVTYAQITVDRLNVRKEATTGSKRIGYLEEGEQVEIIEDLGEWLHVKYTDSTNGYISKEYTQLSESYIYAQTAEETAAQKAIYKTRETRVQTAETSKPENTTKVVFPTTTYTSNEDLRKAIIENAMQYVGNKYVHGGNSLETGTDCSGFTMLIYEQYGYSLSRTPSGQLSSAGRSIDYSEIQPGDIICYTENGTKCSHVAIYIGDGQIVHAANKRKGVCIGKADYGTIIGIKNVID
ncbi:MAG: SH3 domain-containing protein [Lachnospiraceae bacterium]|nr:SH3 domain-containing protein [Lachnospiraceae bacterium]